MKNATTPVKQPRINVTHFIAGGISELFESEVLVDNEERIEVVTTQSSILSEQNKQIISDYVRCCQGDDAEDTNEELEEFFNELDKACSIPTLFYWDAEA
ncbi:hypothetical protein WE348_21720 (plasmid) [Alteromonas macleodii]|uniref:hypothetical protein n=1 Tax=Alteromonas macleodii TaxID=28108 RepID=UPI0030D20883